MQDKKKQLWIQPKIPILQPECNNEVRKRTVIKKRWTSKNSIT
jgi:hypothetical protein